jgi:hypothetical protein
VGDSIREKYLKGELIKVNNQSDMVALLRLADKEYYFKSTPEYRIRSVSIDEATYYNNNTEQELVVKMCPCNLDSVIKFHPRVKLIDDLDIYRTLIKYGRLDAMQKLVDAGHSLNRLSLDFDTDIFSYDFLINNVSIVTAWGLHHNCRTLVRKFILKYPNMVVDDEDMKIFPHHCMDLLPTQVVTNMIKHPKFPELVKRALNDGNTYPYRLLPEDSRKNYRIEILLSGDIGLSLDYDYTDTELISNIRKLKVQVIKYYQHALGDSIKDQVKALRSRDDYFLNEYLDQVGL